MLKRDVSSAGILFVSVSAIVGSGWLFGSLYAAQAAGPAAIIAWLIGAVATIFIAFCFAELACLFPIAGGIGVFPLFSHGKTASFIVSFVAWLAFVVIAPIEVQAVIQYFSNFFPFLVEKRGAAHHVTASGFGVALVLLLFLTVVNAISVKFMSRLNFLLTLWKIIVPVLVIALFFKSKFAIENLTAYGGFAPEGVHGIFASLAVSGIILAFNGFQPGVALAGETKNPQKNIPFSILGSIAICTVLYCLLQFSFLTALPSNFLSHGWANLTFTQEAGPIAGLAIVLGLGWLTKCLYIDALISPMGCAVVFFAAAARTSYAMSKNLFLPTIFQKITSKGIPIWGIFANFVLSVTAFLVFEGWQEMAAFYAAAICLCNSSVPLTLVALRKQNNPVLERSFVIPYYGLFSFFAFCISNFIYLSCGLKSICYLDLTILVGLLLTTLDHLLHKRSCLPHLQKASSLILLIVSISTISYFGSFGGLQKLTTGQEFGLVFFISIVIFCLSNKLCLNTEETVSQIQEYTKI